MPNLEIIRKHVIEQANRKGWNRIDENWLESKLFKEAGELCSEIENNGSAVNIALEGMDVIYMLIQLLDKNCPNLNLDELFYTKYEHNEITKKKTFVKGEGIVRK